MSLIRDRRIRLALELSLLLHLLLAWLLPLAHAFALSLFPRTAAAVPLPEPRDDEPIRFELVDLPDQRPDRPSRADAPASDLSRRAHGGEGAPADRPGITGTTPDLRMAPPLAGRPSPPVPPPGSPTEESRNEPASPAEPAPDGAGSILIRPQQEPQRDVPVIKGLAELKSPGGQPGAVPDRRGGRVDVGPLSFDTQWYDWGPYAAEMLRRIRYHWHIPEIAMLGVAGVTRIHFYIGKDGTVSGLEILMDAEHPPMTFAARDAILEASPLPPLPAELHSEREGVSITFYYNTRPPDEGGDGR